jgi:hypothetical protein
MKHSLLNQLRQAASSHEQWPAQWREPAHVEIDVIATVGKGSATHG